MIIFFQKLAWPLEGSHSLSLMLYKSGSIKIIQRINTTKYQNWNITFSKIIQQYIAKGFKICILFDPASKRFKKLLWNCFSIYISSKCSISSVIKYEFQNENC